MTYTIEKVATLIGARRYGSREAQIRWLLTDSRSLCFPEETLFFALKTKRNDGHRYIDDLYRRGVRNFVVEDVPVKADERYPQTNFLKVVDTLAALQRLAERHRDEFDIPIVGITGSNGKTMVKEWLYQLLLPSRHVVRSPKSYNSQIGVPLSVWLLNEESRVGLFEAGISMPGEMLALHDMIQPTIGVFTCLGSAHQENFRSLDEKCTEKLELFHDAEAVVYCSDDPVVSRCMRRSGYKGERLTWSRENKEATLYVKGATNAHLSTKVEYIYKGVEGSYEIPFIDEASIDNSITCAVTALQLGVTIEELTERMPQLEPVAMRLEVKEGQHGCTLINDSYNSDINSLAIALDFMNRRPEHQGRSRTLVLSDIDQSGEDPHSLYDKVMLLAESRGINKFIGIGKEIKEYVKSVVPSSSCEQHAFITVGDFLSSALFRNLHNEVILLKGGRRFGFEQITELLEQKVHETILEVNLNALVDNLNYFRSFLKPETKMVCMIKADGYGAGAVEIAKTLQDHHVDYLAVAVADEGVTLRKAGITSSIMVMNPEMTAFKTMFDYDLEPEVYSFRLLDALIKAARKEGITGWPVHIKLDTGMHRLGFNIGTKEGEKDEIDELIERLTHQQAVIPRSVFSHFVGSDSDDFDRFSARQFELFVKASGRIQQAFSHQILRHMDNSAGIEHFPERQMEMCRLGIGLYGVDPYVAPQTNHLSPLKCVSTLKTTILQLRHVPKEDTVGYSRKGVLTRDSVIAAIPIGYADGLNRHLGRGRCYCLVNGQKAPYVGNICMDVAMIDVTDIPCQEGDTVEIFGDHLSVSVLAECLDTIPYEVLTGISNRVKRVYFQD
ncbi:MAG: bifunctional UDP-N-acetylmuramoyl-tripeptide:D-alanyl-D-alanine ligase/alanine racemase [Prevotella sp.]|nr:bifunctional UDP-N-acetylmuramoyl-tripeptide:D-alanyl-D-alanine ligase/alanine racemase [Prevotella sp.]